MSLHPSEKIKFNTNVKRNRTIIVLIPTNHAFEFCLRVNYRYYHFLIVYGSHMLEMNAYTLHKLVLDCIFLILNIRPTR